MKTLYVDLALHAAKPMDGLTQAMRRDPDKIVFIGSNAELECMARETGHAIEVWPAGTPVPQGD